MKKVDGMRVFWNAINGMQNSMNEMIDAPSWFTAMLPHVAFEGILYMNIYYPFTVEGVGRMEIGKMHH